RHERGSESTTAIQNELGIGVRNALLDVALDDASAQMDGPGRWPFAHSLSSRTSTIRNFSPASLRRFTSATLLSLIIFFASFTSFRNCGAWAIGSLLTGMIRGQHNIGEDAAHPTRGDPGFHHLG